MRLLHTILLILSTALSTGFVPTFARSSDPGIALTACLEEVALRDDFNSIQPWHAQPNWLSAASQSANITVDAGVACFCVPEPDRGMKWSRVTPEVSLDDMPYLIVRYRAKNVRAQGDDYLVYLDDGGPRQCHALRLGDIISDDQWHVAAVNARRLAANPEIGSIALQVQAGPSGQGRLWIDWLMFADRVPEGATELRSLPQPPTAPDWNAPLDKATWTAQPSWLSDACARPEVIQDGDITIWRVSDPGRGMKWSWSLADFVKPTGHRYLTLHYSATNYQPIGDYAVCAIGTSPDGAGAYVPIVASDQIIPDGRWHALGADLGPAAARLATITGIAIQVRAAAKAPAELRVGRIAFTAQTPPRDIGEFVAVSPDLPFLGFSPTDISHLFNEDSARICRRLAITRPPQTRTQTLEGIPFQFSEKAPDLYCSTLIGEECLRLPVRTRASEIYLLAWAVLTGGEEPSRGRGRLRRIADVDRFRIELEYVDDSRGECMPLNIASHRFEVTEGPQVLCVYSDPSKELRQITLRDRTRQCAFGVAAVTCRTAQDRLFPRWAEETPPLRIAASGISSTCDPAISDSGSRLTLSNAHLVAVVEYAPSPRIVGLVNRATGRDCIAGRHADPLLAIPGAKLTLALQPTISSKPYEATAQMRYGISSAPCVEAEIGMVLSDTPEVQFDIRLKNASARPSTLAFAGPCIGPACLGRDIEDNYYLLPKRGAILHNASANYRERYCGHDMPLQFMSVANPGDGESLYLRTEDTTGIWRSYSFCKTDEGVRLGLEYPGEVLAPGSTRHAARTIVGIGGGDWRVGFDAYRRWLQTWYRPVAARQRWFREVFNFRQKFLWSHDPLCDRKIGELRLERALQEDQEKFGGIEYLHLFDWGYCGKFGRIYGRRGDYSPYDYIPGGRDGFRKAISVVQARGIRVGLYIEGYLLEERGKLGAAAKAWQLIHANGERAYWPKSTEMFMCPWVPAWRDTQANTYSARVHELNVDGMYVDQFGFENSGKDCFSPAHGHRVPGYAVVGERDCMRQIRDSVDNVKRGVALYGEESPCDVNSANQDGSFTYAMSAAARATTLVPLNLMRFAIPTFKTFEILVCDKPTGTWATGVKWVFFNGEGIWLEGVPDEWFAPETLATIRKCHAMLREHRDSFSSDAPEPLVPTEAGGVFANSFGANGKHVFTLYNSRHRTFEGKVLRVPRVPGARYRDAWNDRTIVPAPDGDHDILSTTLEPLGVGCIVAVEPAPRDK